MKTLKVLLLIISLTLLNSGILTLLKNNINDLALLVILFFFDIGFIYVSDKLFNIHGNNKKDF